MAAEPRRAAADALGPGQESSLELPNSGHQGQPEPRPPCSGFKDNGKCDHTGEDHLDVENTLGKQIPCFLLEKEFSV